MFTPAEVKTAIIEKNFLIGWQIAMLLKVIYPDRIKYRPNRGDDGILLPGGCKLARTTQGKWLIKSYSSDDIDEICEKLSKMRSIDIDVPICGQNKNNPYNTVWYGPNRR